MGIQPHIKLASDLGIEYALLPGDPGRVRRAASFLQNPRQLALNREYLSIAGEYKGVDILVMSTGMGGPSTAIAVEELKNIGVKAAIRIGSCGALKRQIRLGELIIPQAAVRNEGTSGAYIELGYPAVPDYALMSALCGSARQLGIKCHVGKIRCHDSFYTDSEESLSEFWAKTDILGCDMESAALFVVGALRGLKTASVLNVVTEYEQDLTESIGAYQDGEGITAKGEQDEILLALESFAAL